MKKGWWILYSFLSPNYSWKIVCFLCVFHGQILLDEVSPLHPKSLFMAHAYFEKQPDLETMCVAVFLDWMGGIAMILSERLGVVKNFVYSFFFFLSVIGFIISYLRGTKMPIEMKHTFWIKHENYSSFLSSSLMEKSKTERKCILDLFYE